MSKSIELLNIYCLYDSVSQEQMPIFQMSSESVAVRNIVKMNLKGTIEFPDDLHLVKLGYIKLDDDIRNYTLVSDYKDLGSVTALTDKFKDINGVKLNERS